MNTGITDFQPKPLIVMDGKTRTVLIKVFSLSNITAAQLRYENRKPQAADITRPPGPGDVVLSKPFDLKKGFNTISDDLAFQLQGTAAGFGAILTIVVTLINGDNPISDPVDVTVSIAAF